LLPKIDVFSIELFRQMKSLLIEGDSIYYYYLRVYGNEFIIIDIFILSGLFLKLSCWYRIYAFYLFSF